MFETNWLRTQTLRLKKGIGKCDLPRVISFRQRYPEIWDPLDTRYYNHHFQYTRLKKKTNTKIIAIISSLYLLFIIHIYYVFNSFSVPSHATGPSSYDWYSTLVSNHISFLKIVHMYLLRYSIWHKNVCKSYGTEFVTIRVDQTHHIVCLYAFDCRLDIASNVVFKIYVCALLNALLLHFLYMLLSLSIGNTHRTLQRARSCDLVLAYINEVPARPYVASYRRQAKIWSLIWSYIRLGAIANKVPTKYREQWDICWKWHSLRLHVARGDSENCLSSRWPRVLQYMEKYLH